MSNFTCSQPPPEASQVLIKNSELHADGVVVGCRCDYGSIIFTETPLICLQTIPNRQNVLACGSCHQYVGSAGIQMAYLSKKVSRLDFYMKVNNNEYDIYSDVVPCTSLCGEIYCSEICRYEHYTSGHKLLCTGNISDNEAAKHPLILFKKHAIETNEIFLLVADVFAKICLFVEERSRFMDHQTTVSEALLPYEGYVRGKWWDVAIATEGDSQEELVKVLQSLVHESWTLLQEVLCLTERRLENVLSEDYMARTIGMFEQNNVGVRLSSPLVSFMEKLKPESDHNSSLLAVVEDIVCCIEEEGCWEEDCEEDNIVEDEDSEEEEEKGEIVPRSDFEKLQDIIQQEGSETLFPPFDGTAFYSKICKMNHSCDPNVIIKYTTATVPVSQTSGEGVTVRRGITAEVVALRDLEAGEELLQSYIDQNLAYGARQKALKDYGFVCRCRKCLLEERNIT